MEASESAGRDGSGSNEVDGAAANPAADPAAEMAQALRLVGAVTGAPEFAALSADPVRRADTAIDPLASLRAAGITVPAEIRRIEVKRRHTTRTAWARGARGGGVEWRFHVQTGITVFRVILLCDPWPTDTAGEDAPQDGS